MMQVMKKTYTLNVVIQEGNDEFWKRFKNNTGCDDVVEVVRKSLVNNGLDGEVYLTKFSYEHPRPTDNIKIPLGLGGGGGMGS